MRRIHAAAYVRRRHRRRVRREPGERRQTRRALALVIAVRVGADLGVGAAEQLVVHRRCSRA